jgi:hypothetical protein
MDDPRKQAAEYRRQAAACKEVAERMSLREDRALMSEMAERWLELAKKAEAAETAQAFGQQQQRGSQPPPPPARQPALQQEQIQPTDKKNS